MKNTDIYSLFYNKALNFARARGRIEPDSVIRSDSLDLPNVDTEVADLWDDFELLSDMEESNPAFYAGKSAEIHNLPPQKTLVNDIEDKRLGKMTFWLSAAATLLLSFGILFSTHQGIPKTIVVEKGNQKVIVLDDGSEILLNSGSEITLHDGWGRRSVKLKKGAAYFSIAKDKSKPFNVFCGESKVSVLGTAFSIYRKHDYLEVVVESGKVNVSTNTERNSTHSIDLVRQEKLTVRKDQINKENDVDINTELGWKNGIVHFDNESLSDVISKMSDYYNEAIYISNEDTRKLKLTGSFKTDSLERFLNALQLSLNVTIQRGKNGSILIL